MQAEIDEAIVAQRKGDYGIGAVIVRGGKILVRAVNRSKIDEDATQHAEIVAIQNASKKLSSRYLTGCVLYSTHEPCPMCASAAIWAKMDGIVFGAKMEDMAEFRSKNGNEVWKWRTINISTSEVLSKGEPKLHVIEEFMRKECRKLFHSK